MTDCQSVISGVNYSHLISWGVLMNCNDLREKSEARVTAISQTRLFALALATTTAAVPIGAYAQGPQVKPTELETIVIKATKNEKDVQKLPDSIVVLKGDRLKLNVTATNAEIARAVPNFNFIDDGRTANQANIRGVGSFSSLSSDDTSVVYYMDEVPLSVFGTSSMLLDVDRIDVLRGPQGTLYGRNTQGGAVNFVPNKPTFEDSLFLNSEIGSDGYMMGQATANGTIVPDVIAGRLALQWSRFDGDIPNIATGGKEGDINIAGTRGTLLFSPDAGTEATLSLNYNRSDVNSPRFLLRDTPNFPVSSLDPSYDQESKAYGGNFRFRHEFETFALTSITSIQRGTSRQLSDNTDGLVFQALTGQPPSAFNTPNADNAQTGIGETTYMQEVRASSLPDSDISWTFGGNFYRSESTVTRDGNISTPMFYTLNGTQNNEFTTNSYAVFGEVTAPVVDKLSATLGLRATHEDKWSDYRFSGNGLPGVVASHSDSLKLSDNALTGRAALSYEWTDKVMTYVSVANGHVSSGSPSFGVNAYLGKDETSFPASKSWTYETGFKSELLNDDLTLNGSVFYNDVKKGHLVAFNAAQAVFTVAALDYESYGGELEATARIGDGLEVFGGVGYTHAELGDIPAGSSTGAASGNRVPNVPEFSVNLGAQYRWSAEGLKLPGEFVGRINYQYVDDRAADIANTFDLEAYSLVNGRLTWEAEGKSVYLFANNIFDERYQVTGQNFRTVPTVRVGQGRVIGIGTSVQF